jgi:hypothetical protein
MEPDGLTAKRDGRLHKFFILPRKPFLFFLNSSSGAFQLPSGTELEQTQKPQLQHIRQEH